MVFIWLNFLKLKNNTQVRGSPAPRQPSSLIGWFEHRFPQSQQQRRAREFRNFGWILPSGKRVLRETLTVQDLGIWTPHAFRFSGRCQNNLLNFVLCSDVREWNPKVFLKSCAHIFWLLQIHAGASWKKNKGLNVTFVTSQHRLFVKNRGISTLNYKTCEMI